jgi:zinc protease
MKPRFTNRAQAIAAAAWLALSIVALPIRDARAALSDAVRATTLPNGLRVLVLENHKAPVAAFVVFYKVGARNEKFGATGISHLVEHLMFRGTKTMGPEQFSNTIQENGGMDNAFTTENYTAYFEVINKSHLDVPIRLEADRMANFAPQGFDSEKAVVIEERRLRTEDNPQDALIELAQAQAFVEHPYHWPVIGWMNDLQRITLDDALRYHEIYYSPQNAVIVAVGDFNADEVMRRVEESFAGIKNGPKPPAVTEVEPPQKGERRVELHRPAELPAVALGFHAPNYRATDSFAIEVAAEILSDGKSSRLYKKLVEDRRMVVNVDTEYDRLSFDPNEFWITAQLRPGVKVEDTLSVLDGEIAALRNTPPNQEELQKAKNLVQASFVYGQDSIFREAMLLGEYEMLGDYRMVDQYLPGIDRVSAADVSRVVREYMGQPQRTLAILVPTGMLPHPSGAPTGTIVH